MLSCYRILDLTDERAFIAGRALSDFGARVVKIEKPGGDPSRFRGPFHRDDPDPEKNLWWLSFNTGKQGITLDIEKPEGRELFLELVKTADAVLESFAPGYLGSIGLGYEDLSAANPGIVLTSMTGFGREGPYRDYKDPDIVVRALGGMVYTVGYPDRPPLGSSFQHTHSLGAMNGAVGTLIALAQRHHTGVGQHVEGITQQALDVVCSAEIEGPYALFGRVPGRYGRARASVTLADGSTYYNTLLWPCKDGYIALNLLLNPSAAKNNAAMMEYIAQDGIPTGTFADWDWATKSWEHMSKAQADELMDVLGKFFMNHTKDELLKLAVQQRGGHSEAPAARGAGFLEGYSAPGARRDLQVPGRRGDNDAGLRGREAAGPAHRGAQRRGLRRAGAFRRTTGRSQGEGGDLDGEATVRGSEARPALLGRGRRVHL
jgi:benzylsuccinate CoA-transferase BbsE subunit